MIKDTPNNDTPETIVPDDSFLYKDDFTGCGSDSSGTTLLADKMYRLRITHRYTQRLVANRLHISAQAYGNYERGLRKPPSNILAGLSELYQVSLMELIELDLADASADYTSCFVKEDVPPYGTPTSPPKPGHLYEQLTLQEFLIMDYFRNLPAWVRDDISSMVSKKNQIRQTR